MIDTSIQLNNHNSYHATELFWADTFSVQTMSHITASFALYSDVVQAAANRIKIRFYTAGGATVSETLHAFAVNTIWERVSVTVPVPATAEKAQICFLQGSYWWAESKVEEGQTATPYAINAAGQLTWISPNGIYTGTVTAQQVIVSPLSGSTEKDLESRLVTINSNAINLRATTDNNVSRLTTIEAGQIGLESRVGTAEGTLSNHSIRLSTTEGAQITLTSRVDGVLPKVTKLTSSGVYTGELVASQITSGFISAGRIEAKSLSGAKLADGTVGDLQIKSGLSAAKITTGILKSANNYSQINLNDGTFSFGNGALSWNGASLVGKGSFESTGGTQTAKMDGGSFRLINGTTDLGYLSIQSSGSTGPQLNAAAAGTSVRIGKVVGSSVYTAYSFLYASTSSTEPDHFLNANSFNIFRNGNNRLNVDSLESTLWAENDCGLGVDSYGPFGLIDGSQFYFPIIVAGNVTLTTASWTTISFGRTFKNAPKVFGQYIYGSTGDLGMLKIRNITTTSFEASIGGSGTSNLPANWVAIMT